MMKKLLGVRTFAAVGVFIGVAGMSQAAAAAVDVENFRYSDYSVRMTLGETDDGRSSARVEETLVAEFPDRDQNRGIVRAIPSEYRGEDLHIDEIAVTDGDGVEVPFETSDDESSDGGRFTVLSIGDDSFQRGTTEYRISYSLENVVTVPRTDADADTDADAGPQELYWDLLGSAIQQPIDRATAEIVVPTALSERLDGRRDCFIGRDGDETRCDITAATSADATTFSTTADDLEPRTAVTLALGFAPESFQVPVSAGDTWIGAHGWIVVAALAVVGGAVMVWLRSRWRHARGRRAIIAQYEPQGDIAPRLASTLISTSPTAVLSAEVLELAIRGAVRIIDRSVEDASVEDEPTDGERSSRRASREIADDEHDLAIELLIPHVIGDGEAEQSLDRLLGALFPDRVPGTINALDGENAEQQERVGALDEVDRAREIGLLRLPPNAPIRVALWSVTAALALGGASIVVVGILSRGFSPSLIVSLIGLGLVVFIGLVLQARPQLLTPRGAESKDHLRGLDAFIQLAEKDRIATLYSVSGSERSETPDKREVLALTERLLPWAVFFGHEKSWAAELADLYGPGDAPTWVSGHPLGFNPAVISAIVLSMPTQASHVMPESQSALGGGVSATSGFSGGFAGGGGGGGFTGGR